jgi:hypothetical protein
MKEKNNAVLFGLPQRSLKKKKNQTKKPLLKSSTTVYTHYIEAYCNNLIKMRWKYMNKIRLMVLQLSTRIQKESQPKVLQLSLVNISKPSIQPA